MKIEDRKSATVEAESVPTNTRVIRNGQPRRIIWVEDTRWYLNEKTGRASLTTSPSDLVTLADAFEPKGLRIDTPCPGYQLTDGHRRTTNPSAPPIVVDVHTRACRDQSVGGRFVYNGTAWLVDATGHEVDLASGYRDDLHPCAIVTPILARHPRPGDLCVTLAGALVLWTVDGPRYLNDGLERCVGDVHVVASYTAVWA